MNAEQATSTSVPSGEKPKRKVTRYTPEQRARYLKEHAESDLSKQAFCKRRGINLGTFMGWRPATVKREAPRLPFAEVTLPAGSTSHIEIDLPGDVHVRVPIDRDVKKAARLVRGIAGLAMDVPSPC